MKSGPCCHSFTVTCIVRQTETVNRLQVGD